MGVDSSVFQGPNGSMRLFTLIIGAIDLGITAHSYERVRDEEFFLYTVAVLFIVSVILAIIAFVGVHNSAVLVRKADYVYHVIGGIILLVAGIMMMISVFDIGDHRSKTAYYVERIACGVLGIVNALIYMSLGWAACRSNRS